MTGYGISSVLRELNRETWKMEEEHYYLKNLGSYTLFHKDTSHALIMSQEDAESVLARFTRLQAPTDNGTYCLVEFDAAINYTLPKPVPVPVRLAIRPSVTAKPITKKLVFRR